MPVFPPIQYPLMLACFECPFSTTLTSIAEILADVSSEIIRWTISGDRSSIILSSSIIFSTMYGFISFPPLIKLENAAISSSGVTAIPWPNEAFANATSFIESKFLKSPEISPCNSMPVGTLSPKFLRYDKNLSFPTFDEAKIAPVLIEYSNTSVIVRAPYILLSALLIGQPSIIIFPLSSYVVFGVILFSFIAIAIVRGFVTDPGSYLV